MCEKSEDWQIKARNAIECAKEALMKPRDDEGFPIMSESQMGELKYGSGQKEIILTKPTAVKVMLLFMGSLLLRKGETWAYLEDGRISVKIGMLSPWEHNPAGFRFTALVEHRTRMGMLFVEECVGPNYIWNRVSD